MNDNKLYKLLDILNYSTELLRKKGIEDARLNVELMLCEILKCERLKLYLDYDKPLTSFEAENFKMFLRRRLQKEPLQYILGKTNFFGCEIFVNQNVLIPRPDTEILVEKTLEDIFSSGKEFINLLEIGTGSGCIAIALSKELEKKNIKHKIKSIDISREALNIAEKNISSNNIDINNIELANEDFFDLNISGSNYDYITSNPPYISNQELTKLDEEIKNYEPLIALTDFGDGFKFYDKLFKLKKDSKNNVKVLLEIGYIHFEKLNSMLRDIGINNFEYYKDYNNINRVLKIN